MSLLRRIRGLLGLAATEAIFWVPVGITIIIIEATVRGGSVPWNLLPQAAVRFALGGAACGFVFGVILHMMDRRKAFSGLRPGRTALWGALGGVAIPVVLAASGIADARAMLSIGSLAIFGIVGAVTSAGTLAVARRAPSLSGITTRELDSGSS